ncbi:MAG: phosphoribosylformylglycinamidine synthase subunit PurS [Acidimicrobiia bacterium]|nr:phosphoribosylformylglycinamidine synthase subunit PurS [Acidimicrobiia bacterium]
MRAVVTITRRGEIADPEGTTIQRALIDLGYTEVDVVRVNRTIEVSMPGRDREYVRTAVRGMCDKMLANPVMEDYEIEILD